MPGDSGLCSGQLCSHSKHSVSSIAEHLPTGDTPLASLNLRCAVNLQAWGQEESWCIGFSVARSNQARVVAMPWLQKLAG